MGFFKKKKKEISKELFGERVLSRMLLTSAQKSPDLFEELGNLPDLSNKYCEPICNQMKTVIAS